MFGWMALAGVSLAGAAPVAPVLPGQAVYSEDVVDRVLFGLDPDVYDALLEDAAGRAPLGSTEIRLYGTGADGVRRPLGEYLDILPSVPLKEAHEAQRSASAPAMPGHKDGFLSGRAVYLSQCHGWIWEEVLGRFATQRGNVHDTVEDFHNPEGMNFFLTTYLENAGAALFTTGERDHSTAMAIADNDGTGYAETGSGFEDGLAGFGERATYPYGVDPFDAGSTRRFPDNGGAVATWTPTVPADGHYAVYISWDADSAHSPNAHYRISHPGGVIDRWYDQTAHGSTWQYTDTLWLTAGASLTVELIGDSSSGAWLSADAVRIGGGMGDVERNGVTSERPRWEEGAIQYIQFNGAPTSVYDPASNGDGTDYNARSRWAEWEHPMGEDAVYLSWHSNASAYGTARGTITYFAGGGADAPGGYDSTCSLPAVDGSYSLARAVQDQLIATIEDRWDPGWQNRDLGRACFGEVSPSNNAEMPSALVELAFHDNVDDALYLKHPGFRRDASRAMYRGIVQYFAERDGLQPAYLPEPPTHVALVHEGDDLRLSWQAGPSGAPLGDPAVSYRVYLSGDGLSWDNGTEVYGTDVAITGPDGTTVYTRVAAVNDGGESLPSTVVGARISPAGTAEVLVVDAFDRFDRGMLEWVYPHSSLGDVVRMNPWRMNVGDIVRPHGQAIRAAGWYFDSASDEAAAALDLSRYAVVVWATGEESTADESISDAQQVALEAYWLDGGALWVSGAEVLWDLDYQGSPDDQAFAGTVLGAGMASDAAASEEVDGVGVLAGVGPMDFSLVDGAPYPVEWPDTLASSRAEIAVYGSGEVAGVLGEDVAMFGFPFDAIASETSRAEVAAALLPALVPGVVPPSAPDLQGDAVVDGVPGGTGTGGTGTGGTGTGGATGATTGTGGPTSEPEVIDGGGGCGCHTAPAPVGWLVWLLALASVVRRR